MIAAKGKGIALLFVCSLACGLVRVAAADKPAPAAPIVFEGYVYIGAGGGFKGGTLELHARRGAGFVPGLVVKLEDRPAVYERNFYTCRYAGLHPAAGSPVRVSIERGGALPGAPGSRLDVTGTMPPWFAVTRPRNGERIAAAAAATLEVSWKGGDAPYSLAIRELATRRIVFRADAVAGTSQPVPMATFTPGTKYKLDVWTAERNMTPDRAVAPGSTFRLGQYHQLEFVVE